MDQAEQMARLRLIRTRNIGPMTYGLLMRRYGSATDAVAAIPAMAKRGGRHISLASLASAKAELELIDAAGAYYYGATVNIIQIVWPSMMMHPPASQQKAICIF